MAINKVIYGGNTIIDLTGDTLTSAAQLVSGIKAHDRAGNVITGTNTNDADTTDATAAAAEILATKTAYVSGNKITGTMPNRGAISATISGLSPYTVPNGFHDGSGTVSVDSTNISAGNIKSGVTILGIEGTYTGESITTQSKTVTPSNTQQIITADSGYDYLAQVTVAAVPYVESANTYGTTVTIL